MGKHVPLRLAVKFCLFALISQLSVCWAKKRVITLNSRNFHDEIRKHPFVAVQFYAPWCQHCQKLEPEFERAAKKLAKAGSDIVLAKMNIDESANKALGTKYAPQLPTIKIFRDGDTQNPEDFDLSGPREGGSIADFLSKLARPASLEVTSAEQIQEVLDNEKVVVVGVFPQTGAEAERKAYLEVGKGLRTQLHLMHTLDSSLLPLLHPSPQSLPLVRVLTTLREEGYSDTHDFNTSALTEFILTHSIPPVVDYFLSEDDIPIISRAFSTHTKKCWMLLDINSSRVDEYRQALAEVSKAGSAEGILLLVGEDKGNEDLLQNFQLTSAECPCLVIMDPEDNGRYYKTKVEPEDIPPFISAFQAGEIENKIKSQPIPEDNGGPLKEVVAKNFKEVVLNSGKNVLIKFYAPWCSYCKDLAPVFEEIAIDLQPHSDILTVKMDLTENDIPSKKFEAKGYPTIFLYTKAGEAIKFEGERTKEEIIKFVYTHMTESEDDFEEDIWEEASSSPPSQDSRKDEL